MVFQDDDGDLITVEVKHDLTPDNRLLIFCRRKTKENHL